MNQDIEVKHTYEIEYMVLSGDYRERRMVAKEIKPRHQGLEYQAKYFEIYSLELKNEIFRTFQLFVLIWQVCQMNQKKKNLQNDYKAMRA